jgi:hypothetical protein
MVSVNYAAEITASCLNCSVLDTCRLKQYILDPNVTYCDYAKEGCIHYKGKGKQPEQQKRRYDDWKNKNFPIVEADKNALEVVRKEIVKKYGEQSLLHKTRKSEPEAKNVFCYIARHITSNINLVREFLPNKEKTLLTYARRGGRLKDDFKDNLLKKVLKDIKK